MWINVAAARKAYQDYVHPALFPILFLLSTEDKSEKYVNVFVAIPVGQLYLLTTQSSIKF